MAIKNIPKDFLDSSLISISDIYAIGGYIPNIVFEHLAKTRSTPLVKDIIPTHKGNESIFDYVLAEEEVPSFEFTAPVTKKELPRCNSIIIIYDAKNALYAFRESLTNVTQTLKDIGNGFEKNFSEWEEYSSDEALYKRMTEYNTAIPAIWGTTGVQPPFEWQWVMIDDSEYNDDDERTNQLSFYSDYS